MSALTSGIGWTFFATASAGVLYTVIAGICVRRFSRGARRNRSGSEAPPRAVSILKPVHGAEPGLDRRLEGFFAQDQASLLHIVFGSDLAEDPALDVAQTLADAHPRTRALIQFNPTVNGPNRKISNLINMARHELNVGLGQTPVVVLSDSDICIPSDYLQRVVQLLEEPGVGVVSCAYFGEAGAGFWSELAANGITYDFFPNVITGVALGLARPCMGSTIALRRTTLEQIGGFEAFRDVLADDYAIGAAVRGLGLRSVIAPVLVSHWCAEATLKEVLSHELRWARTIKAVEPAGYAGSVITRPIPLAAMSALLLGFGPASMILLAASVAARLWLMRSVDGAIDRRAGSWRLLALREAISLLVFVASYFGSRVEWRGLSFQVAPGGRINPVQVDRPSGSTIRLPGLRNAPRVRGARQAQDPRNVSGRRRLIVTADDFGAAPEINEAVEYGARYGILRAASLMVSGAACADAVARAKRTPGLRVGLHLVLVEGRPVLAPSAVPDLVDASGCFRTDMARLGADIFLRRDVRRQVADEITAQFQAFGQTGLPLDHVNAHKHFHLHPTVTGLILDIGQAYGLRAIRVPFEPRSVLNSVDPAATPPPAYVTEPWARLVRARCRRARVASADQVFGLAWSGHMTAARIAGLIQRLPDGLSELYLHPATSDHFAGSTPGYSYADEFAALMSTEAADALREGMVELGAYTDFT